MSTAATQPVGRPSPFDRGALVFWVAIGLTIYGVVFMGRQFATAFGQDAAAAAAAAAIWVAFLAVVLVILSRLQLFERRPWISIAAALVWGGFVACSAAISSNGAIEGIITDATDPLFSETWGDSIAAPLSEETLKALGVLALVLLPRGGVHSTLDGLFYGLLVGLGFQVVEDFQYSANAATAAGDVGAVFQTFVMRGIVVGLFSHAVFTAMTGAGIGYAATRTDLPWARRIGVAVGLFVVAVAFHALWDSPLGADLGQYAILAMLAKGLPALILVLLLVRWARRDERRAFMAFSEANVDPDLLSRAETDSLMSGKRRRTERKARRKELGRGAGRPTKRLQRAQLELVQAVHEDGAGSPRAERAAESIHEQRTRLAALGTTG